MRVIYLLLIIILTSCANNGSNEPWPGEYKTRSITFQPEDKMVCRQNPPDFSWPLIEGAERYHVQVSGTFEKKTNVQYEADDIRYNFYNFPVVFEPGTWYWRVRFQTSGAWSEWTEPRRFRIATDAWEFTVPSVEELFANISGLHPRIYTSRDSLDDFRSIAKEHGKLYFDQLNISVKASLDNPLPEEPVYPFLNVPQKRTAEIIAARQIVSRDANKAIGEMFDNAFVYLITGDKIIGQKAKERLLNLASWNPEGSTSFDVHDIVHRDIAYKSAMAYDWCYDILSSGERSKVLDMIKARTERMLYYMDFMQDTPYDSHAWGTYGFIGLISVAILHDLPDAEGWFRRVIPGYINLMPPWGGEEGGWSEGISYWATVSLGRNKLVSYILWKSIGINLYQKAHSRNEGLYGIYMVPFGAPDNLFGDRGRDYNTQTTRLLKILAEVNNDPVLQWAWQMRAKWQTDTSEMGSLTVYDYLFDFSHVPSRSPDGYPPSHWFRDVGWVAMHSDLLDPDRISCFFKSSWYGSYSHSHADQNSFIIKAFGEELSEGNGYYDFWGSQHHRNYNRQTLAKNAITYDGSHGQSVHDMDAKGEITGFVHHPFFDAVSGNATPAYKGGIGRAVRHMIYLRPSTFVVIDDLAAKAGTRSAFEWNLHSRDRLKIDKDQSGALVESGKAVLKARIHYPSGITASIQDKFISPDGTEVPPELRHAGSKNPLRAIFKMPEAEQTTIISTMEVYRQGGSPIGIDTKEHNNYIELKTDDGSRGVVRKAGEGVVDAGNILFTGAALAEKEGAILLLSGRSITKDGVILMESDQDITLVMNNGEIKLSCNDDISVRFHLPGITTLLDEESRVIPGIKDSSYNALITGIHWEKEGDYVVMDIEKGSYDIRVVE